MFVFYFYGHTFARSLLSFILLFPETYTREDSQQKSATYHRHLGSLLFFINICSLSIPVIVVVKTWARSLQSNTLYSLKNWRYCVISKFMFLYSLTVLIYPWRPIAVHYFIGVYLKFFGNFHRDNLACTSDRETNSRFLSRYSRFLGRILYKAAHSGIVCCFSYATALNNYTKQ